jgi:hypothetical protein
MEYPFLENPCVLFLRQRKGFLLYKEKRHCKQVFVPLQDALFCLCGRHHMFVCSAGWRCTANGQTAQTAGGWMSAEHRGNSKIQKSVQLLLGPQRNNNVKIWSLNRTARYRMCAVCICSGWMATVQSRAFWNSHCHCHLCATETSARCTLPSVEEEPYKFRVQHVPTFGRLTREFGRDCKYAESSINVAVAGTAIGPQQCRPLDLITPNGSFHTKIPFL